MRRFVIAALCAIVSGHAAADAASEASRASLNASLAIPAVAVSGSVHMFRDGGQLSVTGVKTVGKMSVVSLRNLVGGVEGSVEVSTQVLEGTALAAGALVYATASTTGVLLSAAGRALMFVPNEVGMSLMHHSRARQL